MSSRQQEHIAGGGNIRSIILGLNDDLISTFALMVGVAAAILGSNSNNIIT
ncbi:MAG: hypothetical protein KGD65_00785 [Candidatus Lokiarchaeota archaeon]|nr:hypothetical protein [Candidatus Lokiarchaeota archaeon]